MSTGEILAEPTAEEEAKAPSQVKLVSGGAHSMSASEGPDSFYYTSRGLLWGGGGGLLCWLWQRCPGSPGSLGGQESTRVTGKASFPQGGLFFPSCL